MEYVKERGMIVLIVRLKMHSKWNHDWEHFISLHDGVALRGCLFLLAMIPFYDYFWDEGVRLMSMIGSGWRIMVL